MNGLDVHFSIGRICEMGIVFNTANNLDEQTIVLGIVNEVTGGQRFCVFRFTPYCRMLEETEPTVGQDVQVQTTEAAG